jgi:hypothetical protein
MLSPLPDAQWSRRHADHLLSRASFGGSPAERDALYELGVSSGVAAAVDSIVNQVEDWGAFPNPSWGANYSNGDAEGFPYYYRETEFVGWYVDQMRNAAPLAAKMFKFYVDHFPVDPGTFPGGVEYIYLFKHFRILRDHALGNFGALVKAVSWSEAMMAMLDLDQSRRGFINENFGRELLELFTLGVTGGYSELDVNKVAAAFTGRMLQDDVAQTTLHPLEGYLDTTLGYWDEEAQVWYPDDYRYIDMSEKSLFGVATPIPALVPGTAPFDQGEQVIDLILSRAQCAKYLGWKLWRYFVEPDPDAGVVDALKDRFRDVHAYEVRPLLRDIFLSEEFYASGVMGNQIKDPIDLVVGTEKMLEATPLGNAAVSETLDELGYTIYSPPNIAGWPEPEVTGNGWLGTGNMMFRLNFPAVLTHGERDIFQNWWRIPDAGAAVPWVQEFPFPEFIDWDLVVPQEWRGMENFDLLLEGLEERLLPFQRMRAGQKRALLYHASRTRAGGDEEDVLREVVRQILSLPESQLQ